MVRESQDWFLITKNHGDRSLTPPTKCNNMNHGDGDFDTFYHVQRK